jgi:hypothetical protein
MTLRSRIATLLVLGAIASGGVTLILAGAAQAATCPHSSAGATYAGQGSQVAQLGCSPTEPTSNSTLPFTGLDLGLLVGAALILIAGGTVLRLRLRHGGR